MTPYYYPANYQQYSPQYEVPKTVLDRVQGEASANVYPVQPGQEVILFDIDNPHVYRKERGLDNKLTQKRFRLVEDEPIEETPDMAGYVKYDDIAQMIADAVDKKMSEYTLKPTKKKVVVEEE